MEWIQGMEAGKIEASSLYSYFKNGDFKDEDILEAYRVKDSPRFLAQVQEFVQGKLFHAQTENFDDFIEGKNRKEDKYAAWLFLSVEESAQQKHKEIHAFIEARIYCGLPSAKDLENLGFREKMRDVWLEGNKRNGWSWRK